MAPPPLPAEIAVRGVEPTPENRWAAMQLAFWLGALGLFSAAPGLLEIGFRIQHGSFATPRWALLLLAIGFLQFAYAVYLAQLPDWSSVWVVAIAALAMSTLHAVLLAGTLFGGQQSGLVGLLELHDQLANGRASGWAFILLALTSLLAYFAGRMAVRWQTLDSRLRALDS